MYREVVCFDVMKQTSDYVIFFAERPGQTLKCFAKALFPKLYIKIVFFTENDGYFRTGNQLKNSQHRFRL